MHVKLIAGSEKMYLKRLKDLREDKEKIQEDIANLLQITRQQYSLYETGKRDLPIDLLKVLAEYYETSSDYIIGLTNKKEPYPRR